MRGEGGREGGFDAIERDGARIDLGGRPEETRFAGD